MSEEEDIVLFKNFLKAGEYYSLYRIEITVGSFEIENPANPLQKNFERFRALIGEYKISYAHVRE